jgi:hypothetical protein
MAVLANAQPSHFAESSELMTTDEWQSQMHVACEVSTSPLHTYITEDDELHPSELFSEVHCEAPRQDMQTICH